MTDEEAVKIVTAAHGVDGGYGATSMEIALVQAGYRAAMEEVNNKLFSIRQDHRVRLECEANKLKEWLDEQVNKETP